MSSIYNKVAFIICISDMDKFAECRYYIDRLILPEGFEKDIVTIQDAPSMAAGYNAGMDSSDAKYKVYMHQDVLITNCNFITDIQKIFESDPGIGILGCVGTTDLGREAMAITSWNTGKVIHNGIPMLMEFEAMTDPYTKVMALDGLLLATQYDIRWREDIMDGWDFYDISQCMEFSRAGYQTVVPRQDQAWCYHDNQSSNMTKYNYYRKRFIDEYASDGPFEMPPEWEGTLQYQELKHQSKDLMEQLIDAEDREQLHEIFLNPINRKYIHLKEYEVIADVDYLEQQSGAGHRLWESGVSVPELLRKVRQLKYWIKRIEYQAADTIEMMDKIMQEYSVYAVVGIFEKYVFYQEYTYQEIEKYLKQKKMASETAVWDLVKGSILEQ